MQYVKSASSEKEEFRSTQDLDAGLFAEVTCNYHAKA